MHSPKARPPFSILSALAMELTSADFATAAVQLQELECCLLQVQSIVSIRLASAVIKKCLAAVPTTVGQTELSWLAGRAVDVG